LSEVHKNYGEGFVSTINPGLNAFPGYLERNKNALYWLEFELELSFLLKLPGRPLIDMGLLSLGLKYGNTEILQEVFCVEGSFE
jgi:hypothetical protein